MKSGVVLISGRGSNLKAILTARLDLDIRCVISNRPEAKGLDIAFSHQIPTRVVNHQAYPDRQHFDQALAETIDQFTPDYIILAGFLRIFTDTFVLHYNNRMINIHPSLLPAFTGLNTHARALAAGVKVHGCTVHFVTPTLDVGPIIIQAAVPVFQNDTEQSLAQRVLEQEHLIYPKALSWLIHDQIEIKHESVHLKTPFSSAPALISPWN